jgi:predicted phage baseplate assembly protein
VDSAVNLVDAKGGFDLEDPGSIRDRGLRTVRHRHRAVTAEDYEDLARLASPQVARAKCIPRRDLSRDPDGFRRRLGAVSLLVVPHGKGDRPIPGSELLDRVRHFLDDHRDPSAELIVVGPDYVLVSVEAELSVDAPEMAGTAVQVAQQRLREYLHPLYGGPQGHGWDFGWLPQRSDLYGLCASLPGVHHLRSLRIVTAEERLGAIAAGRFLISSGTHTVKVRLAQQTSIQSPRDERGQCR